MLYLLHLSAVSASVPGQGPLSRQAPVFKTSLHSSVVSLKNLNPPTIIRCCTRKQAFSCTCSGWASQAVQCLPQISNFHLSHAGFYLDRFPASLEEASGLVKLTRFYPVTEFDNHCQVVKQTPVCSTWHWDVNIINTEIYSWYCFCCWHFYNRKVFYHFDNFINCVTMSMLDSDIVILAVL